VLCLSWCFVEDAQGTEEKELRTKHKVQSTETHNSEHMLKKLYLVFGCAVILIYGVSAFQGWEFGTSRREVLPADVRNSPGGYRSFHFWHTGFHGGK
jgi:hypothetical protein